MATKKAAPKKQTTAIVPWSEKFASYAKQSQEQVADIGVGGASVRFGRDKITVNGQVVGKSVEVIVLGYCGLNAYYKDEYDSDNIQAPDCYAFADALNDKGVGFVIHPNAANPQAEDCESCALNEYGSEPKRHKGKACGNRARLGLLVAKDVEDGEAAESAEMATGSVTPTSLKAWAAYVKALGDRPPWSVVTQITSHDDPAVQIRLEFKKVDDIDDDGILLALEKRYLGIQKLLQVPFSAAVKREPAKASVKKGGRR